MTEQNASNAGTSSPTDAVAAVHTFANPLNSEPPPTEEEEKSASLDISPKTMGYIAVAFLLPVDLLVSHFEGSEKGRAAAIFVAATCGTVMFRWSLKREWWFWTLIVAMLVIEGYLVQKITWYGGNLPAACLLPEAAILIWIQFGCIAIVKKTMKKV